VCYTRLTEAESNTEIADMMRKTGPNGRKGVNKRERGGVARSRYHWTASYIRDRALLWLYHRLNPDVPWLTKTVNSFLECWLKSSDIVWEWGAGRSTVWLGQRVASLTSVEESLEWVDWIRKRLAEKEIAGRVKLLLETDAQGSGVDSNYVRAIYAEPEASLDLCIIDGAVRDACAVACLEKVKPGGIVVVDDIQRYLPSDSRAPGARRHGSGAASPLWQHFVGKVVTWRCIWTSDGVRDTAVWIKPVS
jgi:hypothetical protein